MALSCWRPEFLHDFSYLDDLLDVNLKPRVSLRGILRNTGSWSYWQTHPINHMKSIYHIIPFHENHSMHHSTHVRSKVAKLKVFESGKIEVWWHKRNQRFKDLQWNYITSSSTLNRSPTTTISRCFWCLKSHQSEPTTKKKHLNLPSPSTPHPETTAVGMGFSLTQRLKLHRLKPCWHLLLWEVWSHWLINGNRLKPNDFSDWFIDSK